MERAERFLGDLIERYSQKALRMHDVFTPEGYQIFREAVSSTDGRVMTFVHPCFEPERKRIKQLQARRKHERLQIVRDDIDAQVSVYQSFRSRQRQLILKSAEAGLPLLFFIDSEQDDSDYCHIKSSSKVREASVRFENELETDSLKLKDDVFIIITRHDLPTPLCRAKDADLTPEEIMANHMSILKLAGARRMVVNGSYLGGKRSYSGRYGSPGLAQRQMLIPALRRRSSHLGNGRSHVLEHIGMDGCVEGVVRFGASAGIHTSIGIVTYPQRLPMRSKLRQIEIGGEMVWEDEASKLVDGISSVT